MFGKKPVTPPNTLVWVEEADIIVSESKKAVTNLENYDKIYVQQEWNLFEALSLDIYEASNKYKVQTPEGKVIFYALEQSSCCQRCFCSTNRGFRIKLYNQANEVVMTLNRKFKLCPCFTCCSGCLQEMKLFTGDNDDFQATENYIGSIKQPLFGGLCRPRLNIFDASESNVCYTVGPQCVNDLCCDAPFEMMMDRADGPEKLGEVKKLRPKDFRAAAKEQFTDADNFVVDFPKDFDDKKRSLQLASSFLIDFMFFEDNAESCCACPIFRTYLCGNACGLSCCAGGGCAVLYCCGVPIVLKSEGG